MPASQEYLGKEIDNIVAACDVILKELVEGGATDLSVEEIKRFNAIVLKNLELDDGVVPGEIRKIMVGVARYRAVPPQHIGQLLEQMCRWLNHSDFKQDENRIAFGIFRAVLAHLYIAWIHPFGDGNGRTARLVEFKILLSHGVPSAAAHLLSNHYNHTRTEYYRQLDKAGKSKGDIMPFIEYAVRGFIDGLIEQLMYVRSQQLSIAWRDYVYSSFSNKSGVNDRRIKLALDISERNEPVQLQDIRRLTPRLAEIYANKTYRTILRDVTALTGMKLLVRRQKGYRPNWEILKGFLPICISPKTDTNGKQKECMSDRNFRNSACQKHNI